MSRLILTITQVNDHIRAAMDADPLLSGVAVRGEISNYKVYPSGHHYFTLKDETSSLKAVMFKGNASRLKFRPENGLKVIVMGRITVYPRDGAYQLYATAMIPGGAGDLHVAFEQLKKKLAEEGLFDESHKKALPRFPKTIGIITSPAGAAVHDMLRILRKRFPIANVRLLPVRVQGAEAPAEIVTAIQYANRCRLADVLIVGRGGGSIEDLWAFNDELVARAIYASQIPVISAVGHEPDVTIADFVADLRAATPSNAAELAVPDKDALYQTLDSYSAAMGMVLGRNLEQARKHLQVLSGSAVLKRPEGYLNQQRQRLEHSISRIFSAQERQIFGKRQKFVSCAAKLDALSPLKVLTRGYSVTQTGKGRVVSSVSQVKVQDEIQIAVTDGTITANVLSVKENVQ